jgi:hypothetical protein
MNRTALVRLGLALVLGTLTAAAVAQRPRSASPPIVVTVVDGAIQVSTAGLTISSDTTSLVWQIGTPGYRFTSGSIDFGDAQAYFSCSTYNDGQNVGCTKSRQAPKGTLSYRISLSDGQSAAPLVQSDVFIQND